MKRGDFVRRAAARVIVLLLMFGGAYLRAENAPDQGGFIRGALLDSEQYDNLPQRAELSSRDYQSLPVEVSLKKYAPIPGDQTPYGTCVAWAAAYGARTISESVITERRQTRTITGNVYSPVFVYKSINDDPACLSGTQIFTALDLMREQGVPRMLDIERTSDFRNVSLSAFTGARKYAIADYVTLFRTERAGRGNTGPTHVQVVKKSLAERKPVIIGMNTPESFTHAVDLWRPAENPHRYYGGHAMVVVGYDDNRHGGAFEVLNSWGKKWGNSGYIWISYETFGQWVREAYEIIENLAVWSDVSRFSGFVRIEIGDDDVAGSTGVAGNTGAGGNAAGGGRETARYLPVTFNREGYYTAAPLPRGAGYRLLLENTDPAYLYAFTIRPAPGGDTADGVRAAVSQVFPPADRNIVPILDYAESYLALPGEDRWIPGGEQPGDEYLVVLYAKQELNVRQIRARLGKIHGTITGRVAQSVNADLVPLEEGDCKNDEMRFTVESGNNRGVFALIVKLERL